MNKGFKFISRLIVGIALIIISGVMVWNIFNTIVVPKLPVMKGADYVQDLSGSMKEPDKTYARNAIEEDSKKEKIAIVLDYQLTSFTVNDTYVDKMVNSVVKNVYRNQKYIVYTYFRAKIMIPSSFLVIKRETHSPFMTHLKGNWAIFAKNL